MRLPPVGFTRRGAGCSSTAITLGAGARFSSTFPFQITNRRGINPADWITCVVAQKVSGLGSSDGSLRCHGAGNSVAVEFHTFNNGGRAISSNHVAVDKNGVPINSALANP